MTASRAVEVWRQECKRLAGEDYTGANAWRSAVEGWHWRLWLHMPGDVHIGRHAKTAQLRQPGYAEALAAEMVAEAEGRGE